MVVGKKMLAVGTGTGNVDAVWTKLGNLNFPPTSRDGHDPGNVVQFSL